MKHREGLQSIRDCRTLHEWFVSGCRLTYEDFISQCNRLKTQASQVHHHAGPDIITIYSPPLTTHIAHRPHAQRSVEIAQVCQQRRTFGLRIFHDTEPSLLSV